MCEAARTRGARCSVDEVCNESINLNPAGGGDEVQPGVCGVACCCG